jgi:glycosyltransferase involved in cell wall biosynthesis
VIPAKNEERAMSLCIRSILSQDYNNMVEIIVIDDYSTDNTATVAKQNGAMLIVPDLPSGRTTRAHNKNLAIQYCSGDYIIFLDAHIILPSKKWLRKVANFIKSNNLHLVSAPAIPPPELTPLLNIFDPKEIKEILLSLIIIKKSQHFFGGCMIISRETLIELGGFPEIPASEDIALYKRATSYGMNYMFLPELWVWHLDEKLRSIKCWVKRNLKEGFYSCAYGLKYVSSDKVGIVYSVLLGLSILGLLLWSVSWIFLISLLSLILIWHSYWALQAVKYTKVSLTFMLFLILTESAQAFLIRISSMVGIATHLILKLASALKLHRG